MSCEHKITVYSGSGNTAAVVFGYTDSNGDPQLFDFGEVTRYLMTLEGDTTETFDSDVDVGAITYAGAGTGELVFDLGLQGLPSGTYQATLRIFTPLYPTGYLVDTGDEMTMEVYVT